jgi:hypothetical protein
MSMKKRLSVVAGVAVACALALSGCGGGGSSSGARLTKAEFSAKANALCTDFNKKIDALPNPTTEAEMSSMLDQMKGMFEQVVAGMKKLNPPAESQAAYDRIMVLADEQLARVDDMIAALKAKDLARLQKLTKEGDTNDAETNKLFKELGATSCGNS